MEYEPGPNAEATAPVATVTNQNPLPVEDLERRLALLKAAGVREYHDVGVKIAFEPKRQQPAGQDELVAQVMAMVEQERETNGG